MGDVSIIIKNGHVIDDEDDTDDIDWNSFSGSGENDLFTTTPQFPVFTPTSNSTIQKATSTEEKNFLPYIIAGVAVFVLLILILLITICYRRRRRQRTKSSMSNMGPVVYTPNQHRQPQGGDGYSTAIPLTSCEAPLVEAPPPPVPSSVPPHLSASGSSASSTRYTPLGGRKAEKGDKALQDDEKNNIYESIDDDRVTNVYEEAKPALPKTDSGRRPRVLSSEAEDPNMGSEKDKMLPTEHEV